MRWWFRNKTKERLYALEYEIKYLKDRDDLNRLNDKIMMLEMILKDKKESLIIKKPILNFSLFSNSSLNSLNKEELIYRQEEARSKGFYFVYRCSNNDELWVKD